MIDMTDNAEPSFVYEPRFLILSAKIVGNMIESKKPSSTTAQTGAPPDPAMAVKVQRKAQAAKSPKSLGGAIRFIMADPAKRPTMKPIRCHFRTLAAALSGVVGNVCWVKRITKLVTPTCAPT